MRDFIEKVDFLGDLLLICFSLFSLVTPHPLVDLFITDRKYGELRLKDDSSLAIKDFVSMRVYEVVKPLRDQVEAGKCDRRFLTESKSAVEEESARVKDELVKLIDEKKKVSKSCKELETKLKEAEERIKENDFKKVLLFPPRQIYRWPRFCRETSGCPDLRATHL